MIQMSAIASAADRLFAGIEFTAEPSGLYDPLRYMIGIGGKRIRPRLCLLAYTLFRGGFSEEIFPAAEALEVFHTFTLIHDDIMDCSPLRRGKETVWKKWSEDTAILSGDVMLIDSYRRISRVPEAVRSEALALFSRTAAQVCEGQQYDMEFESRDAVRMDEYERMIGLKTAVLIACAAKMGAIVAGAGPSECDALYDYGYKLGMAFQIADDYLDAFGDEKVFGKPIGGDIVNSKKSWLTIAAARACEDGRFASAIALPVNTPEERSRKIGEVCAVYRELGVDKAALDEIRRYSILAMDAVSGFSAEQTALLREFCDSLVGRSF